MADTVTLSSTMDPFSIAPEKKTTPVGGRMGFFEDGSEGEGSTLNAEAAVRAAELIVSEIGSAGKELINHITGIEDQKTAKPETDQLKIGGESEIQFNDPETIKRKELRRTTEFHKNVDQSIAKVEQSKIEKLNEEVKRNTGGEANLVDVLAEIQPNITKPSLNSFEAKDVSINTAFLVWNSRQEKLELTKNPPANTATNIPGSPGQFVMRQGEMDMGKERAGGGHFTTAPG